MIGASVNVPPNWWLLQIFQTFEAFGLFDDFSTFWRLFDRLATTTTFIATNLMLANWLSSVSTTTTNPNYTLPGLCWLGTRGFQHRGKWCSYPAKLGWTVGNIWWIQGRPGYLVLTLRPWPGMTCPRSQPSRVRIDIPTRG